MTKKLLLSALLVLLLPVMALAQGTTSLTGSVTDPSGAVVPGSNVAISNTATGFSRTSTTDAAGNYSFLQIPPGEYSILVKKAGFPDTTVNAVRLLVSTPATVNVQFESMSATNQTVSVSAEAVQLNTSDATIGNSFGTKPILQLPFEGRNVVGLLSLQPGVTFNGSDTSYRSGNISGSKNDQSNVTLDGVDVNDVQNRVAFAPALRLTLDSVQEFRLTTTNANADGGRGSGAQIQLITKRGTNDYHGSAYWFLRNKATNANTFFNNAAGLPLQKLNRNVPGVSFGGPVLPKLRDRLFFFFNYEAREDRREDSILRVVPTQSLRNGNLIYPSTAGGNRTLTPNDIQQTLDPLRIGVNQASLAILKSYPLPNDAGQGDGLNTAGYRFNAPIRLRYNTTIARIDYNLDRQSKNTVFIRGNLQKDTSTGAPQFPTQPPNTTLLGNSRGLSVGVNSVLSPTFLSTFRYGFTRYGAATAGVSNLVAISFRSLDDPYGLNRSFIQNTPVHNITQDFSWIKGKHTVQFGGNLRGTANNRINYANSFPSLQTNASWLAGSGSEINAPFPDLVSSFRSSFRDASLALLGVVTQGTARYNYTKDGTPLAIGAPVVRHFKAEEYEMYVQDTWKLTRALTIVAGVRYTLAPPIYEAGGTQTVAQVPLSQWFATRNGLANVGAPQSLVDPVRYVLSEQTDLGGRPLYPYHKNNFGPRFSIAYSPQADSGILKTLFGGAGKSSLRAGFGVYYDQLGSGLITNADASSLGLSTSLQNPSGSLRFSTAPRLTGLNTIPAGLLPAAPASGFPVTAPNAFAITNSLDDNLKSPYTLNMNISFSREVGQGLFVQAAYVGRLARRTLTSEDIATPTNLRDSASGIDYFSAAKYLVNAGLAGTKTAALKPNAFWENVYPGLAGGGQSATQNAYDIFYGHDANSALGYYPDITSALYDLDVACDPTCSRFGRYALFNRQYSYLRVLRSIGNSNYHGLQLSARKSFKNGDQIDFNYTFSKTIDQASTPESSTAGQGVIINPWSPRQSRAVADYDVRHNWNMNWVYNLPFGRGRHFASGIGKLADAAIGGWQLAGLYRQSSGYPVSVGNGRFWPTNWNITGSATQIGPFADGTNKNAAAAIAGVRGGANIFQNPAAARQAFTFTLPGESGTRNAVRGDGFFNIDASLSKNFKMPYNEKHTLQFRWEVFNATNSVRFDPLAISLDLGNIGSFGKYNDTFTTPRVMQFGLRYDF